MSLLPLCNTLDHSLQDRVSKERMWPPLGWGHLAPGLAAFPHLITFPSSTCAAGRLVLRAAI